MNAGWVVEVHAGDGVLLYAARVGTPDSAEDVVRKLFNIPADVDVFATRPIDDESLVRLHVPAGEARGPM